MVFSTFSVFCKKEKKKSVLSHPLFGSIGHIWI